MKEQWVKCAVVFDWPAVIGGVSAVPYVPYVPYSVPIHAYYYCSGGGSGTFVAQRWLC